MNAKKFILRLMFDKEDNMDLSQLFLWTYNIFFLVWIAKVGTKTWAFEDRFVDPFLIVYGTTVLLSSPTWLMKLWIQNAMWFRRTASATVASAVTGGVPAEPPVEPPPVEPPAVQSTTDIQEVAPAAPITTPPQPAPWVG